MQNSQDEQPQSMNPPQDSGGNQPDNNLQPHTPSAPKIPAEEEALPTIQVQEQNLGTQPLPEEKIQDANPATAPFPPPPPSSNQTQSSPSIKETPVVQDPKGGGGINKALKVFAIIISLFAMSFFIIKLLIPRLQGLKLPGFSEKETTLVYWGLWEPVPVMEKLVAEFETQNPNIKVKYLQQNHKDYRERLQSAIARGEGPDIFRYHNTWVPMFRDELDAVPSSVFSASEFQDTFYPTVQKDLRRGASFIGIPLEIDGLAMFYNKNIFKAAAKTPPSTWDELRKTAFELTTRDSKGRIQTAGAALGTTNNIDHWPDILALMLLQNGAALKNPTDKLAQDAILFYTLFYRSDKVWDETLPNSTQAFAAGKVAMIFAPSWRILDVKDQNPDLDFGVLPVPLLPNSNITWASYWVEGVSAKSEHKNESWKFLQFISTKESLEKLYLSAANDRGMGEPYSRKDLADLLKDDPYLGAYISQAETAQAWYMSSATHDNGINDKIIKYFEDVVNSLNSGGDLNKSLETASQGITQILSQYKVN